MGILFCALVAVLAMGISYPITSASTSYETYLNQFEVKPLGNDSLRETFTATVPYSFDICHFPSDCTDVLNCDHNRSRVYRVFPFGVGKGFLVFCDMETSGGGWLVFQRRQDGSVDFERKWAGYKQGFGNLYGEFWLDLEKLHLLTTQRRYELMINIENYSGKALYALYSRFHISGEKQKFRLMLGTHSGTAVPHSFDICHFPSDCTDVLNCDHNRSGVYRVFPFGVGKGFLVFCDMETSGGAWLVFQRRQDGSVDFERKWTGYKQGFGNLYGEFWLGLEKLHLLTSQRQYELMINIENYTGKVLYALYSRFHISGEKQKFRLMLGTHSGTAADAMTYHSGYQFSTADSDNDDSTENNCGAQYRSGWWYKSCHYSNLNGEYVLAGQKPRLEYSGIAGYTWLKEYGHLQFAEMKIRSVGKS